MRKYIIILSLFVSVFAHGQGNKLFFALSGQSTGPIVFDPDAETFFTAGSISDAGQKSKINTLVVNAKSHGWWSLCQVMNLWDLGSSASLINLKQPGTFNSSVSSGSPIYTSDDVDFNGSLVSSGFSPSADLADVNSSHLSYYSNTNSTGGWVDIGVQQTGNSNSRFMITVGYGGTQQCNMYDYATSGINATPSQYDGFLLGSRTTGTQLDLYFRGSNVGSSTGAAGTAPSDAVTIGQAAASPTGRHCVFSSIGAGINSSIAALMAADVQNYVNKP